MNSTSGPSFYSGFYKLFYGLNSLAKKSKNLLTYRSGKPATTNPIDLIGIHR